MDDKRKRNPEIQRAIRHLAEAIKVLSDCKPDNVFAMDAAVDDIIVAITALGPRAQKQVEDYLEE